MKAKKLCFIFLKDNLKRDGIDFDIEISSVSKGICNMITETPQDNITFLIPIYEEWNDKDAIEEIFRIKKYLPDCNLELDYPSSSYWTWNKKRFYFNIQI